MYADYAYYKDSFGGDVTAEEFNRYARKAERFLNYVVMEKISEVTEPVKNALGTVNLCGKTAHIAKTGYTGEPVGYEIFALREDGLFLWDELVKRGAKPIGLGARDTLRMEAGLPLYGHELGLDKDGNEIPIFAISLARFAVSFAEEK